MVTVEVKAGTQNLLGKLYVQSPERGLASYRKLATRTSYTENSTKRLAVT